MNEAPTGELRARLRRLPAVDRVIAALPEDEPPSARREAARRAIDRAREQIRGGEQAPTIDEIVAVARDFLDHARRSELQRVLNATGVFIHTNLGRVPLSQRQLDAVAEVARGYSNLEYDLVSGSRGSRYSHATRLLQAVTGAEAALAVNNNAAAVLLVLAALCGGREVILSRGELIEIGGEFRIPEVLAASGARLVEVGTTNRTHLADYERAVGPETAAILKVHPSNYRVVGFTASVPGRDLARLARGRGVCFIHDLGSGFVGLPEEPEWTRPETPVGIALQEGADLVTFSGDKLLGGPQAGIILGARRLIEKISAHPLLRAVRVDKMTLAALEATLRMYLEGAASDLPLWQMALADPEELEQRARSLAARIAAGRGSLKAEAVATGAVAGGGSLPGAEIGSWAVSLMDDERSAAELERSLREGDPPVIARIEDDRVLLDLRTVAPADDDLLVRTFCT